MSKIIIDAGHTDHVDPGAVANGTTEHAEVKQLALDVVAQLKQHTSFAQDEIILVPTEKTLIQKIQYINSIAVKTDLVMSIHLNSASATATGTETYYLGGNNNRMLRATTFQREAVKVLGLRDRGVAPDTATRHGRLGIIRDVTPESMLIEVGFITNISDLNRLRTVGAQAVVRGMEVLLQKTPTQPPVDPIIEQPTGTITSVILTIEKQIDVHLQKGKQITQWENELLKKRQDWDMELDRLRGVLLNEIEQKKAELNPLCVDIETKDMRALALANNDLIGLWSDIVQKRNQWDNNTTALRKALQNYLPRS